ncbi:hypothetical protein BH24ACT5_BH24ACT5_25380 [soil metagenome]
MRLILGPDGSDDDRARSDDRAVPTTALSRRPRRLSRRRSCPFRRPRRPPRRPPCPHRPSPCRCLSWATAWATRLARARRRPAARRRPTLVRGRRGLALDHLARTPACCGRGLAHPSRAIVGTGPQVGCNGLAVAQLGSAPALGAGGREFESPRPDRRKPLSGLVSTCWGRGQFRPRKGLGSLRGSPGRPLAPLDSWPSTPSRCFAPSGESGAPSGVVPGRRAPAAPLTPPVLPWSSQAVVFGELPGVGPAESRSASHRQVVPTVRASPQQCPLSRPRELFTPTPKEHPP